MWLTVIDAALKQVSRLFKGQELVFAQESVVNTISLLCPRRPVTRSWSEVYYQEMYMTRCGGNTNTYDWRRFVGDVWAVVEVKKVDT